MARDVLITGATGTLGHRVVGEATEAGHNVRALSRRSTSATPASTGHRATCSAARASTPHWTASTPSSTAPPRAPAARTSSPRTTSSPPRAAPEPPTSSTFDRRHRPHPDAVLQGQAEGRGSVGRVGARPHDHPGHAVPRPHRDDVLHPALLACPVRGQGCALPADRHPRRRDPPGLPIDDGPAGRVDDIGGPAVYDHDELGRMYLDRHAAAVDVWWRFPCPAEWSPA